jgi:hypothetical protein
MLSLWTLEIAQFVMVAYYILVGAYSMQLGSNVRMNFFYSAWSDRKKSWIDAITVLFLGRVRGTPTRLRVGLTTEFRMRLMRVRYAICSVHPIEIQCRSAVS